MEQSIKVVIAEDQGMLLSALSSLLALESDISVIGQASDGQQAQQQVNELSPDIVLTDIEMPKITGIELVEYINQHNLPTKCIIMTTFSRAGYVNRALQAGVKGYLLKDAPIEQLADAIRRVHNGKVVIDPELVMNSMAESDLLTDKERKILQQAELGLTTEQIADTLFLAHGTVRNYLSVISNKLGTANRMDSVRIARQRGLL